MNTINTAFEAETRFADVADRKIAYRTVGQGQPIMLANRFRGIMDTWDPLFLDKLAENHQVVIFDYSGIGQSTGSFYPDATKVAEDVKDLAAALHLENIVMLGWSYGGLIAQIATFKYPELISRTVLIGTNPPGERKTPLEPAFLERAFKSVNGFEDEVVLFFEPASTRSVEAAKRSHERIARRLNPQEIPATKELFDTYFKGALVFTGDPHWLEQYKTTHTPILIISGDHDISFAVENWFPLIRHMPTAQLMILPNAGHGPQHQHPELVVGYIDTFLRLSEKL